MYLIHIKSSKFDHFYRRCFLIAAATATTASAEHQQQSFASFSVFAKCTIHILCSDCTENDTNAENTHMDRTRLQNEFVMLVVVCLKQARHLTSLWYVHSSNM